MISEWLWPCFLNLIIWIRSALLRSSRLSIWRRMVFPFLPRSYYPTCFSLSVAISPPLLVFCFTFFCSVCGTAASSFINPLLLSLAISRSRSDPSTAATCRMLKAPRAAIGQSVESPFFCYPFCFLPFARNFFFYLVLVCQFVFVHVDLCQPYDKLF